MLLGWPTILVASWSAGYKATYKRCRWECNSFTRNDTSIDEVMNLLESKKKKKNPEFFLQLSVFCFLWYYVLYLKRMCHMQRPATSVIRDKGLLCSMMNFLFFSLLFVAIQNTPIILNNWKLNNWNILLQELIRCNFIVYWFFFTFVAFMKYATAYLNQVLEKVKPLLRGNGGPIIMVQVMNLHFCDNEHYYATYAISNVIF